MTTFIDLSRRFRDLTPAELEEPELLAALSERELHPLDGWPDLLKHARVLVLAEAGSGKTIEMKEQAKRLVRDGKTAFFIALESLDRESPFDILSTDDELLLTNWLKDGKSPAWFFLDAVDELKLTNGKFDRAIRRFAKSISGHLGRARILISCRPYDWRPEVDMATVRQLLPISQQAQPSRPEPDQIFLAALRQEGSERRSDDEDLALTDTVRTVVLAPLGRGQIERLARSLDVIDTEAFLAEIDKQNAWTFARRPLDLSELVATWAKSKRLGTRVEQHEANIAAKLWDDTDRPDRNVLPDTRARIGAERLALALALTRTRTIRSPDQALALERAEGVLDPAQILNDWSEHERRTLLRRALFDPATYGRVRFHHRSVQEYLAACHFQRLRDSGMSTNAMLRLLFANRYGVDVVIPSMRAIAAWLALWDEAVRRELMAREPEALLSLGDPETLPLEARAKLVRAFAAAYGKGGWRGLGAPIDEVRRLAHPELAEVVQELWGSGPTNTDVRELLLELIWQGRMESCADIANSAALDTNLPYHHRVVAIRSLLAIGRNVEVRDIAEKVLGEPGAWPDRYISALLADLFPRVLSVAELMTLIEHFDGYTRGIESFVWSIEQIVESLDPASHLAIEFRDALADLLWRGRDGEQSSYQIRSRFSDLAPVLALLCGRQLAQRTGHPEAALVRASVLATRFGEGLTDAHNRIRQVRGLCNDDMHLREAIFWTELTVMDKLAPAGNDWNRLFNVEEHSLIESLQQSDQPWLEAALVNTAFPERRPVALHALIDLWSQRGRHDAELQVLQQTIESETELVRILTSRTSLPKPDPRQEKMNQDRQRRQQAHVDREQRRISGWMKWKMELLADPVAAFSPDSAAFTVENLYKWLNAQKQTHNRYDIWDHALLFEVFGTDVATRAQMTIQALWRRQQPPVLWSQRLPEQRNSIPWTWVYGLCGVSSEAAIDGWPVRLTPEEARLATTYATVELNGLAPWIKELARTHPDAVDTVLGRELDAELAAGGEHDHLPILQDIAHAEIQVRRIISPRLFSWFMALDVPHNNIIETKWVSHLERVIKILEETTKAQQRVAIAAECRRRFIDAPIAPLSRTWLRGLFRFDLAGGGQAFEEALASVPKSDRTNLAIGALATLFGDSLDSLPLVGENSTRATTLGQLVRCAYKYVRQVDDQRHDGVYEPNLRDHAQRARMFLLSTLQDTPGPSTYQVLLELASEPYFADIADRLRLSARQRAAEDADFSPYAPADLVSLEERLEAPPHDRDGLFDVMLARLDDLAHDLAHDDFTDRRTLRTITDEAEMQRTLAGRIRDRSRGAYTVTREDEVADQKRTDIRLASLRGGYRAAIEVKVADSWTIADFERALRQQLLGQYLRHQSCKAGCLLLTYQGRKTYWEQPNTGTRLEFYEVVRQLSAHAEAIEAEQGYGVRIAVFGLDLTDPILEPAHRHRVRAKPPCSDPSVGPRGDSATPSPRRSNY